MFRKKLSSIEIFPKFLCSCCWSNKPHRDSKNLDRKDSDVVSTAQTHRSSGDGASLNQTGIKCHCFFKATFNIINKLSEAMIKIYIININHTIKQYGNYSIKQYGNYCRVDNLFLRNQSKTMGECNTIL